MAKSKKSKILAMALCASVMTGIYAAPVMAYPYQDGLIISSGSSGNIIEAEPIVEINGVRMTYGYLHVTNVIAANALDINGDAFTVDKDGNAVSKGDVTSTTADGRTTYTLNTVGENTSGITSHSDGKVTTIEGAFSVNENGYIYNKNGSFKVTRDGAITASSYNGVTLATYGEQVLVGDIDVSEMDDNTAGIVRSGETTTIEKTVSADKWGLKVLDENGKTVAYINSTNGGIYAANGKFHVYSEGQIEGTALSLMNNGAQNVYIDNSGTARFGDKDGNNVRIENGVLYVNRNNEQVAALGENGLTLTSSNNSRATLDAEQIANLNTTVKAGNVVDAKELNVTGAAGGLYVKDVTNENSITGTMIYTKAADGKTNTMWIDPNTGNLNTVGSIGVGSNLAKPVTQINGIADANGDGVGDINVGISYNEDGSVAGKKINLDASTGDINLVDGAKVDGVDVSELSKNVGDIGADLGDNGRLGGITRTDEDNDNKLDTTTIEGTTSFDANGMRVTNENDGRAVAITKDRGIEVFGGNGASNAVITNNGTARFGAEGGANVRIENGDVTSTYYDKDGNKGSYSLNTIGANTAGIERIQNSAGNDITEIEDTLRIYDNGTISTVNGEFRINEQGNVFANAVNVADGAVVISENSINAFDRKFTVNENGGVSTTGINVAKGMFTASDGGVTMANNKLSVDLNGNIKAGTYNGVKIDMNKDGDIILGGTVIDDNFNSDNVAGITRKPLAGSANTTYIEQNTAISADGIVVTDPDSGVSTKTKYDGFYVKEGGTIVSSLTSNNLTVGGESVVTVVAGNVTAKVDRLEAGDTVVDDRGMFVKENGDVASSLTSNNLTVGGESVVTVVAGNVTAKVDRLEAGDTVVDDRGVFVKTDDQSIVAQITEDGLKLGNESLTATKLGTINDVITDKGEVKSQGDVTSYDAINDRTNSLNDVASDLNVLEGSVGDIGDNVAGIKRNAGAAYGEGRTVIEDLLAVNGAEGKVSVMGKDGTVAVITKDGTARFGVETGKNLRWKNGELAINSSGEDAVAKLSEEGLMLTDANGAQTLTAAKIADIKGITRDPVAETTTIEGVTSFNSKGMTTTTVTTGEIGVGGSGFYANSTGITVGNGRFSVDSKTGNLAISNATVNGTVPVFQVNGETGQVNIGANGGSQTVITGNSITTETLHVQDIVLGNEMTDKDGNSIALGADGTLKVNNKNYSLNLDETGFNLYNADNASFSFGNDGFAFAGPVHLGNGTQVEFSHNGTDISLSSLVDRVEDLEQKTTGISFDENTGNTTIKDMNKGTDGKWTAGDSSVTVGDNGTTFENGKGNGATNINGGAIDADSSSIGDNVSGGSGSGSSGMAGNGTYTDDRKHSGHFVDGDNSYEFTNDANGFTGTVTDSKHTTTIENDAKGSNTTVTGGNTSASSGVGIGNDGAFISDSVTNGDMTVTEVKDKNGSATTVKDANGSSTVSQDTKGQTVSTGTGTSVNTGNDFGVTDNETGKSIYMSDIGHVEDIDSEIQNSDGSKTTVVDAVNNEAEIRRSEIERVDGRINNLENRVGKLEDRIDKVGAMAAAIANLRTMGYDPAAPTEVAVGIGQYRDDAEPVRIYQRRRSNGRHWCNLEIWPQIS